jgi:hypothetical protein
MHLLSFLKILNSYKFFAINILTSAITDKKKLISLIFPEKIEFKGKNIQLEESMMC